MPLVYIPAAVELTPMPAFAIPSLKKGGRGFFQK